MYTITLKSGADSTVLSESENAKGDGFLHIITRLHGCDLETEFTEFCGQSGKLLRHWFVSHRKYRLPMALNIHLAHEHVLATHQNLFRVRPKPYLAQVVSSLFDQVNIVVRLKLYNAKRQIT